MQHKIAQIGYLAGYSGNPKYHFNRLFDRRIAVSFDTVITDPTADYRVLVQCEPPALYTAFKEIAYNHYQNFDLILAYDERILALPNAQEFIPVGSWVDNQTLLKTNQISYLMSSKIWTGDHRIRFQILREVEGKSTLGEFDFYMHRSPPRIDSKDSFFTNAKFHIACENQVMNNMFSEKLLDCFRTLTVPIYYGCKNIEKYFDPRGIIRFNTIEEFNNIIKRLTPADYDNMLPYVKHNYEISKPYWEKTVYERIEDIVETRMNFNLEQTNNQPNAVDAV
jgi:hypothetical protein